MKFLPLLPSFTALTSATVLCRTLHPPSAPVPDPNTPAAFSSYSYYSDVATTFSSQLPGYDAVTINANASVASTAYQNFYYLKSYDVATCAAKCDEASGCEGFNIYFERAPSLLPNRHCPNPEARAIMVCALYSQPIHSADVMNAGQTREEFEVVIRGSNVWNKRRVVAGVEDVTVTKIETVTHIVTSIDVQTSTTTTTAYTSASMTENTPVVASPTIASQGFSRSLPHRRTQTKAVAAPDDVMASWTRDVKRYDCCAHVY